MTENEILLLQDRLYEYLKGLHHENPDFLFELRYHELELGYWFSTGLNGKGNRSINTSFMEGFNYECHLSYDVEVREWTYTIKGQVGTLGTMESNGGTQTKTVWVTSDFLESLAFFIKNNIVEVRQGKKPKSKPLRIALRENIRKIDSFKNSAAGKSYYNLLAQISKPHLPLAIFSLEVCNFQGIKHIIIDNMDINAQWIFLTGENGFGKTSLLRAIALGLTGDEYADQSYLTHSTIQILGCDRDRPFMHPKYQYELPKLLSDAFPKVQFIVSTHSPIPLLGVPKTANAVVLTVHRTAADGITVERLDDDIPFRHLLPNSLLTSPIFGFENLFPRATPPAQIITTDHWKDIEKPLNLKKELARLKSGGFMD